MPLFETRAGYNLQDLSKALVYLARSLRGRPRVSLADFETLNLSGQKQSRLSRYQRTEIPTLKRGRPRKRSMTEIKAVVHLVRRLNQQGLTLTWCDSSTGTAWLEAVRQLNPTARPYTTTEVRNIWQKHKSVF